MKRTSYKKLVTEKIKLSSARYLLSLKESHSKSTHLTYSKEMQPYLRNESLTSDLKKLMFRLKNRLINVKINFKEKYKNDLKCRLCAVAEESQQHLVECSEILRDSDIKNSLDGFKYEDIFSTNLKTQTHLVLTWKKIMKTRNAKLKHLGEL